MTGDDGAFLRRDRVVVIGLIVVVSALAWAYTVHQARVMDEMEAAMWRDMNMSMNGMEPSWTPVDAVLIFAMWTAMMAAMMLPGTAPAVNNYARTHDRSAAAMTFVAAYVTVWTLFGVAAYPIYRPHGTAAAGIVTLVAGLYELTPIKRHARQRCRQPVHSGFHLGFWCVASTVGLMVLLLALGAMNVGWMVAIATLVLVQKLLPPRAKVDGALALTIIALGVLILINPSAVPGLAPAM
jgi:predicted metal-binding membrane protein